MVVEIGSFDCCPERHEIVYCPNIFGSRLFHMCLRSRTENLQCGPTGTEAVLE